MWATNAQLRSPRPCHRWSLAMTSFGGFQHARRRAKSFHCAHGVTPANAGDQMVMDYVSFCMREGGHANEAWIPACAGMTQMDFRNELMAACRPHNGVLIRNPYKPTRYACGPPVRPPCTTEIATAPTESRGLAMTGLVRFALGLPDICSISTMSGFSSSLRLDSEPRPTISWRKGKAAMEG